VAAASKVSDAIGFAETDATGTEGAIVIAGTTEGRDAVCSVVDTLATADSV
jgi:hypothetical protein